MQRVILAGLWLLAGAIPGWAQAVSWVPAAPRIGDAVTIRYDSRSGLIGPAANTLWLHWGVLDTASGEWSTPPQSIWPAGSRLHTDNIAVQSPMTRGQDSVWSVTIDFDTTVRHAAFVFTDGANQWDNNNNQNWVLRFVPQGLVSWWTPEQPQPGDAVTILYDAVAGTLPNGAANVLLHWGVNEAGHGAWQRPPAEMWPPGSVPQEIAVQTPMVALGGGLFQLTIATLDTIRTLHYVFTDGTNWDNNGERNWGIELAEPPAPVFTWETFRFDPRSAFAPPIPGPIYTVSVAGTFNGWSMMANPLSNIDEYGTYWAEVRLPAGASQYKFVINGTLWISDPDNPRTAPGGNNSLVVLAPDTLPQAYDVQPGENLTYNQGAAVTVTVRVRPGDLGPGIQGTPTVRINGQDRPVNWDPGQMQLSFNLMTMNVAYDSVEIAVTDSAGRTGRRALGYAFKQVGFAAADPVDDFRYGNATSPGRRFDLIRVGMLEGGGGETILMSLRYRDADLDETLTLVTIASEISGWGPVPGFGGELHVPELRAGGRGAADIESGERVLRSGGA